MTAVAEFLETTPVIEDIVVAEAAKVVRDRTVAALDEIEAERVKLVKPLNDTVNGINAARKEVSTPLARMLTELKRRLSVYLNNLEIEREKEAVAARARAAEAERLAREAEAREREAMADADVGVEADVGTAIYEADMAFDHAGKAAREAARAEAATKARLAGGFGKSVSLRTVETLHVQDWRAAIEAMGINDDLTESILKSARLYRKLRGELPPGIGATTERKL